MKWPNGFTSAGTPCGIKAGGESDLGVLLADEPVAWSGVFTANAAAAVPVRWSRSLRRNKVRCLVVNSGNANACTGAEGERAVEMTSVAAGEVLGCEASEILLASTGPIGQQLPVERIVRAIPRLFAKTGDDVYTFAESIMTTDTKIKTAHATAGDASMVGVAKGAAMLAPNMATMLAFVATDASVDDVVRDQALATAVDRSFNRLSIDACESTNDSVFLLASGKEAVDPEVFSKALQSVCGDLAEQIARDAEGGTKLVRVFVHGGIDEAACVGLGKAVAASDLWRAAVNGEDPNWGRVVSALGAFDRGLDLDELEVSIGSEKLFSRGQPVGSLASAAAEMKADEFTVSCRVGDGDASAEVLTADLSKDYVALNSEGTS